MKRLLGTRGFLSVMGALVVVTVVAAGWLVLTEPLQARQSYCAIMPDAVGLYPGNDVTERGVPVGTVTAVRPQDTGVRVDFAVDAGRPLRGRVGATTVSDTLVSNRNLAVLTDPDPAQRWDPAACITDTLTPKSMSQTLSAVRDLARQLTGSGDPLLRNDIRDGLARLDQATQGLGPRFQQAITQLGQALASPDAAIGHLGEIIDKLAPASDLLATDWAGVKAAVLIVPQTLDLMNNRLFGPITQILLSLESLLPWANDLTKKFGDPLLDGLDGAASSLRWSVANAGTLRQLIQLVPSLTGAVGQAADPGVQLVLGMTGAR
ncbi:MlaD family protein [Nocardia sp. NPDC051030]|uniref:MlaD family protein n=1 Tax=Nocardia sp. NPDC051030 TaxID=3155162 RepID=UPI00342650F1